MPLHNPPLANKAISDQFGFSKTQMGLMITATALAYACGQIINGLLTDKMAANAMLLYAAEPS